MAFEPKDFVVLAIQICDSVMSPREAHARTAYSRAYYAAFLVVRERLRPAVNATAINAPGCHGYVISCLRNSPEEWVRDLGAELSSFEWKRRQADYHLADCQVSQNPALGKIHGAVVRSWIKRFAGIADAELLPAIKPPY